MQFFSKAFISTLADFFFNSLFHLLRVSLPSNCSFIVILCSIAGFLECSFDIWKGYKYMKAINRPRLFHIEATWKRPFPRRFNVEYTWCLCRVISCISNNFHNENSSLIAFHSCLIYPGGYVERTNRLVHCKAESTSC